MIKHPVTKYLQQKKTLMCLKFKYIFQKKKEEKFQQKKTQTHTKMKEYKND